MKFDKGGGHNKARSIRREEEYERKKFEATRRFQKDRVKCKKILFIRLSGEILMYLSIGKVPDLAFRSVKDQLIQSDYSTYKDGIYTYKSLLNEEEEHAWVKEIKGQFLEAVIAFQIVILIPRSNWENAVKTVKEAGKEELGNKLFKLIIIIQEIKECGMGRNMPGWDLKLQFQRNLDPSAISLNPQGGKGITTASIEKYSAKKMRTY